MTVNVHAITGSCLILFGLYWALNAAAVKPNRETKGWLSGNWYSVLFLFGFLLIIDFKWLGSFGIPVALLARPVISQNFLLNVVSIILSVAGLAVAIMARRALGGNWSRSVAFKEGHELITEGPYRYVRHPIYTGVLAMAAGVALSYGTFGACIGFPIIVLGILLKLRDEEQLLCEHFPAEYPPYRKHTRMILPFVL